MRDVLIARCAWHQDKTMPLRGFNFTDGICISCLIRMLRGVTNMDQMRKKYQPLIDVLQEGAWTEITRQTSYWCDYIRKGDTHTYIVGVRPQFGNGWHLMTLDANGNETNVFSGDLTPCLEKGASLQ